VFPRQKLPFSNTANYLPLSKDVVADADLSESFATWILRNSALKSLCLLTLPVIKLNPHSSVIRMEGFYGSCLSLQVSLSPT